MKLWNRFISNLYFSGLKSPVGRNRCKLVNLYHCCLPKTGSQWIGKILSDPAVYAYSGLKSHNYQSQLPGRYDPRNIIDRTFTEPFPKGSIVTPLYISFDNFVAIPKPEHYKAFFVMRDPRDILISWYFSMKHSHTALGNVVKLREILDAMSFHEGISYAMAHLNDRGYFQALASWIDAPRRDPNTLVVRFEDLIGTASVQVFDTLFRHCDVHMPQNILRRLLTKYSFEALAGRKQGEERKEEHYRKGTAGDWMNYLTDGLEKKLEELTDNLIARLGLVYRRGQWALLIYIPQQIGILNLIFPDSSL
jgi:Sulfotransferase domain